MQSSPKLIYTTTESIIDCNVELRELSENAKGNLKIDPRHVESQIRLSEAHAKARLSKGVEIRDVEEVLR